MHHSYSKSVTSSIKASVKSQMHLSSSKIQNWLRRLTLRLEGTKSSSKDNRIIMACTYSYWSTASKEALLICVPSKMSLQFRYQRPFSCAHQLTSKILTVISWTWAISWHKRLTSTFVRIAPVTNSQDLLSSVTQWVDSSSELPFPTSTNSRIRCMVTFRCARPTLVICTKQANSSPRECGF